MAIEDIWFDVNYKLPSKPGKYIVKDETGYEYICNFSTKRKWIDKVPFVGYQYNHIERKDIVAWRYIKYE